MSNAVSTPLRALKLDDRTVWIKDETQQIGGSFKFRGPDLFFHEYPDTKTVVAASSGNHAIGVSTAARLNGAIAHVFLPEATPLAKLDKIRAAGAIVHTVSGNYEEALADATAYAASEGIMFLPSYDHPTIIRGNRDLYLEAIREAPVMFTRFAVPIGGGGCISAAIEEAEGRSISVLGGEYEPFARVAKIALSGDGKDIQTDHIPEPATEGIAIRTLGQLNRRIISGCADFELQSVSYAALADACRILHRELNVIAELGGCAGLAAALAKPSDTHQTLCVVTGGNIDADLHARILKSEM